MFKIVVFPTDYGETLTTNFTKFENQDVSKSDVSFTFRVSVTVRVILTVPSFVALLLTSSLTEFLNHSPVNLAIVFEGHAAALLGASRPGGMPQYGNDLGSWRRVRKFFQTIVEGGRSANISVV